MAYVRGNRGDYDRWAAAGLPNWSYAHVLPYFRRQEAWEGGASDYRGGDGPLTTQRTRFADPLVEAYAEAGAAPGHPGTDDYNGARAGGISPLADDDPRWPPLQRRASPISAGDGARNLDVETDALVSRVLLEGKRASASNMCKAARHRSCMPRAR